MNIQTFHLPHGHQLSIEVEWDHGELGYRLLLDGPVINKWGCYWDQVFDHRPSDREIAQFVRIGIRKIKEDTIAMRDVIARVVAHSELEYRAAYTEHYGDHPANCTCVKCRWDRRW